MQPRCIYGQVIGHPIVDTIIEPLFVDLSENIPRIRRPPAKGYPQSYEQKVNPTITDRDRGRARRIDALRDRAVHQRQES